MLVSTVELFWRARRAEALGLRGARDLRLDWPAVVDRKNALVREWGEGKDASLARQGIAVMRGRAKFLDAHELEAGADRIRADRIIVATGSSPARPPIPGIEHALTSDGILDLRDFPERLVIVGGGVIAMEFAFAFGRAGSEVTILEAAPHILGGADAEMRDALAGLAAGAGISIHLGAKVKQIGADRIVEAEIAGALRRFPADQVLVSTGRPPNVEGLGLEAAGVAFDRRGISVDRHLRSVTAPHVYAAGDVAGRFQLSPVAWYEGGLAARNAVRGAEEPEDYSALPSAVFTIPTLAQVGLTEEEARSQGLEVAVSRSAFEDNPAAGVSGETEGFVKLVHDASTGKILGFHVLGAHAADLIQVGVVALRAGLTREQLGKMHYVFPALAGSVIESAIDY